MNNTFIGKFTGIKDKIKNKVQSTINNNSITTLIAMVVMGALIFGVFTYISYKSQLNKLNCSNLKKIYTTKPILNSVNSNSPYLLRDFYVKTAYNCCSSGQFKNDFVNICALVNCIEQGVRCLDFEIYSINNEPVVATSSLNTVTTKETYNSLPMSIVLEIIGEKAFDSDYCTNNEDPLILHFRFMSENCKMYNKLALLLSTIGSISGKLLETHGYENGNENLGKVPIKKFNNKIIIMVYNDNPLYRQTKLHEYVNIATGTTFARLYRFKDILYTHDHNIKEYNKKYMSIVLPDISPHYSNFNINLARYNGCQFVGMSFQNYDTNLEYYNKLFDGAAERGGFVLKPEDQRYVPLNLPAPPCPRKDESFDVSYTSTADYNLDVLGSNNELVRPRPF